MLLYVAVVSVEKKSAAVAVALVKRPKVSKYSNCDAVDAADIVHSIVVVDKVPLNKIIACSLILRIE